MDFRSSFNRLIYLNKRTCLSVWAAVLLAVILICPGPARSADPTTAAAPPALTEATSTTTEPPGGPAATTETSTTGSTATTESTDSTATTDSTSTTTTTETTTTTTTTLPETPEQKLTRLTGLMRQVNLPDVRIKAAQLLHQVQIGLPPETFYKKLAELDVPKEHRFFLMEVKKDIGNILGNDGLRFFLGAPTAAGGSAVETRLLTWRRQMVMEGIKQVIQEFRGKNSINGQEFRVYYAEIGGWANETPDQMKFEGDIDFSFVCGSQMLAWQMKMAFDSYVKNRLGLTGQQADTVCTAHGMAEPEVYVGEHGKIFAERAMETSQLKEIDLKKGVLGSMIEGSKVLENIAYDARKAGDIPELARNKTPTEPGISMEMVRHFLHDIMHNPVYTDIDSFLKAAKYTFRSNDALGKAFGLAAGDAKLDTFVRQMLDAKKAGSDVQTDIIRDFFDGKMPWGVELGPNQGGKSRLTIRANKAMLDSFFARCRDVMWDNAAKGFEKTLSDLKAKAGAINDGAGAARLKAEMDAVLKMMEIEFLLFDDPKVGAPIDGRVRSAMTDLRSMYKGFMHKWGLKMLTTEEMKEFKFLEAMLKQGGDWNIKTVVVGMINTAGRSVDTVNMYLDILDDKLMGELRGESGEWRQYLENTRKKPILDEWNTQGRGAPPSGLQQKAVKPETITGRVEKWMNGKIHNFCLTRKIRNVNMILGESIQSSAGGRAMMKGMIAVNLAQEIPAYIEAYNKEGWKALATEFFRRRVPFGSVTEHLIMGRYGMAAWDTVVTFVPPAALFQIAANIGAGIAEQSWKLWWSTELTYFVDELYEDAEFVLKGTDRISDDLILSNWRLAKIKYRNVEVTVEDFAQAKQDQIREMIRSLETPHRFREFPIEYKYEGLTGLFDLDMMLRENLEETDNFLFMINEMKKHPAVGEQLKDHYMDLWITRWEQVKLNFILKTIAILEDRRKAEQIQKSGKLEEVVKELMKAAEKLKIKDEVQKGLEGELGKDIYRYFSYLKDIMVGLKREFYGQPDVWDEYEEGTRTLIHYLETYRDIIEARKETEEEFALGLIDDRGLRLITGPYFLKGKADQDKSGHRRWRLLPEQTKGEVKSELEAIKAKYVSPGTLEEQGYDRRMLDYITRHDVWREAWKHVNSQGTEKAPSFWEVVKSRFSERDYRYDRNPALARFKFHKERRDKLVEEFEEHYKNKAEEEPPVDPDAACKEALEKAKELSGRVGEKVGETADGLARAAKATEALAGLPGAVSTAEAQAKRAGRLAEQADKLAIEANQLTIRICAGADRIGQAADPKAELKKLEADLAKLKTLPPEMDSQAAAAEAAAQKVNKEHEKLRNLPADVSAAEAELAELAQALAKLKEEAAGLPKIEAKTEPTGTDSTDSRSGDQPEADDCPTEYVALIKTIQARLDGLAKQVTKAKNKLAEQKGARPIDELLEKLSSAAADADDKASQAGQTAAKAAKLIPKAEQCLNRAAADLERTEEQAGDDVKAAINNCDFERAGQLLDALPAGDRKTGLQAELDQAKRQAGRMREVYREARAEYRRCAYDRAEAKINQAIGLAPCAKFRESLSAQLGQVAAARTREEGVMTLYNQARADKTACNLDAAVAKLNQALGQTKCGPNRQKIYALKTEIEGMIQSGTGNAALTEGKALAEACKFEEAIAKLNQAAASGCGAEAARAELARVNARQAYEAETKQVYSQGRAAYKNCRLDEAIGHYQAALGRTRCPAYKAKINKAIAQARTVQAAEEEAKSLLEGGRRLAQQNRTDQARQALNRAKARAKCRGTKAEIDAALAALGDGPPPPNVEEPGEPYVVALQMHLPWPTNPPKGVKPPKNADKATKERIKAENRRRAKAFIRSLSLSQCTIKRMDKKGDQPLLVHIHGEALKKYSRQDFQTGQAVAADLSGNLSDKGKSVNLNGALLFKVGGVYADIPQALAANPLLAERIRKNRSKGKSTAFMDGLSVSNEQGTGIIQEKASRVIFGPWRPGWSAADKQKALMLTKTILNMLADMGIFDCFVAGAVYRNPQAEELNILRHFRDGVMARTEAGRRLIRFYYRNGPGAAAWVYDKPWLVKPIKTALDRLTDWLEKTDPRAVEVDPRVKAVLNWAADWAAWAEMIPGGQSRPDRTGLDWLISPGLRAQWAENK